MISSKAKFIWITTSSALGTAVGSNCVAQTVSPNPTNTTPVIPSMSKVTAGQINSWVTRIRMQRANDGPSTDPDYSEFWIEMRPATPDDKSPLMSLGKPLSGLILPNRLPKDFAPKGVKAKDLTEYIRRKANAKGGSPFANWSEEAWGEITPDFAEVVGPDDEFLKSRKKNTNGKLSIRALEQGKPVPPEYYQEILKQVTSARTR